MAAGARRPRVGLSDREGRPCAHCDAEDLRPAAGGARGPAPGWGRASRQAAPLPNRGQRARPARPPDDRGAVALCHLRREAPKDPCLPAPVPGRRGAHPHGGGQEEARRCVAADAGGRGGRAGAPRPRGGRGRRGAARRDPHRRVATAALSSPRSTGDRRHRPRVGERDPARGQALALLAIEGPEPGRGGAPPRRYPAPSSPVAWSSASAGRTTSAPTVSTTSSPSRASCAALRSPASTSRSTRSTTARSARPAGGC